MCQVDCEGDALLSADISSSGESLAFGDGGGFVHLWSAQAAPRVNLFSGPTELPELRARPPAVSLRDGDSFAAVPQFPAGGELPLSAYDPTATLKVGMAPRIVDPSLLDKLNQVLPSGPRLRLVVARRGSFEHFTRDSSSQ